MAKKKSSKSGSDMTEGVAGAEPGVVAQVVDTAKGEGLPPKVAKEIVKDSLDEGVAPDKLREVAEEAVRIEREDREAKS